jgi:hypothetical protein
MVSTSFKWVELPFRRVRVTGYSLLLVQSSYIVGYAPSYLSRDGTSPGKSHRLSGSDILGPTSESKRIGGEAQGNERSRHGKHTREMHLD